MAIEQLGPYRIVRTLGRGGMGAVYEGVNVETGQAAAVKVLAAGWADDEGFRDRFQAEIETLLKLNHPGIVRLFGFGEAEGNQFFAMELVDGVTLEHELRKGRRFPWREAAAMGIEICRALRHAHDRGVIHRDLKPGNLMLAHDGRIKLTDFGIARLFGHNRLTAAGSVLGTAEYMAPEQAHGRPVDARADLYSLGGVLYALLAGRPPLQARSLAEMLYLQQSTDPEPIGALVSNLPHGLAALVTQLLQKDPEKRVPNATLVIRRLEALLENMPALPETLASQSSPSDDDGDYKLAAPSASDAPPPAASDPLAVTRPTAAFQGLEAAGLSAAPGDSTAETAYPSGVQPAVAAPVADRFIAVPAHALDRVPADDSPQWWQFSLHTGILVVALLAVGAFVWYLLQPSTADHLYDKIAARTHDGTVQSLADAEDDIEQFLARFPQDSRAAQLRQYKHDIELDQLEHKFEMRAARLRRSENLLPIERDYLEAIQYAHLTPEAGIARLQSLLALYDQPADHVGVPGQCLELARRRLDRLNQELEAQAPARLELLQGRLDAAERLTTTDPARAVAMWKAVIALYDDKPWAAAAVARARAALARPGTMKGNNQGH